ncbi:hypothetical protein [Streptomyces longisporus]|uniref:Uncharacterized protein n=1 Tax=Streptomyces longisporus TaxID=1948 RepID=A0ABP6AUN8_STRLO
MSNANAVFLGITALGAAVIARVAFRLALSDGTTRARAWAAAGTAALAAIADPCIVGATLEFGPSGSRVILSVLTGAIGVALAYVGYDVTGPTVAPAGGVASPGLSRPKRLAAAAACFSSAFAVLALILPFLK